MLIAPFSFCFSLKVLNCIPGTNKIMQNCRNAGSFVSRDEIRLKKESFEAQGNKGRRSTNVRFAKWPQTKLWAAKFHLRPQTRMKNLAELSGAFVNCGPHKKYAGAKDCLATAFQQCAAVEDCLATAVQKCAAERIVSRPQFKNMRLQNSTSC